MAEELGGDAKTEMWYIADCDPGAKLYVGFKDGVTKEDFAASLQDGSVADKVHAIEPEKDQSIFIPSGRLHAIGAGFLIYEIQQNSDTTYRVFDWNRLGLDGNPRDLHVEQSMKSIDFDDHEPGMDIPTVRPSPTATTLSSTNLKGKRASTAEITFPSSPSSAAPSPHQVVVSSPPETSSSIPAKEAPSQPLQMPKFFERKFRPIERRTETPIRIPLKIPSKNEGVQ
jgi:mannose-6-phosphate isomerase class I